MYRLLNIRASKHYVHWRIDELIPLKPVWVVPYVWYYPFTVISFVLLPFSSLWKPFMLSYMVGSVTAWCIWYFFPTGVTRPIEKLGSGFPDRILRLFYTHDYDTNALPSGHVLHTVISAIFLSLYDPSLTVFSILSTILITLSTVFTKQHYVVDAASGLLLGIVVSWVSFYL